MRSDHIRRASSAGLMTLLAALHMPGAAFAGVTLSFSPAAQTVAPGATFDVLVTAEATDGAAFNAIGLHVGFDPAALTPVALSPLSAQIGPYMTGACGSFFHQFHAGASVDTADCSMLCSGVSLNGSGTVYHLRFKASTTVQTTTLRFLPATNVDNAGLFVLPLTTHDAGIGIGTPAILGVGDTPHPTRLALAIGPNPTRAGAIVDFGTTLTRDATVTIHDLQGRTLRAWTAPAGSRSAMWDGRDRAGVKVAAGTYLVSVRHGAEQAGSRITVVR